MRYIAAALVVAVLLLVIVGVVNVSGRDADRERQAQGAPGPSMPPLGTVPRQRLDTERLPMSPDQRAAETDQLRALWDASPNENPPTHLRANPGPHEPA